MEAPRQVRWAVRLLWMSLIGGMLLVVFDPWTEQLPDEFLAHPWMKALLWSSILVMYGLWAVLIALISRRRNWARILYLVMTIAGLALMAYPWDGPDTDYREVFSPSTIVFSLVDLAALYWLFSPAASRWFAKVAEASTQEEVA